MKTAHTLAALLVAAFALSAQAQTPMTPKSQLAADTKAAALRYTSDKTLCNDEANGDARLQCRRDAKAQYDKALADARARSAAASATTKTPVAGKAAPVCAACGKVRSVSSQEKSGEGGAVGLIAGGVAGALLGNQVGQGVGKDLATIAGAAGGAYAGKKIEGKAKSHTVWSVAVEFEDGSKGSYEFDQDPGLKAGDAVKKSGTTVVR
jgi:outer membrane lipoprotein SlyB